MRKEVQEKEEQAPEKITHAPTEDQVGQALSLEAVQEILDDMVRPALQGDGGDIELVEVTDEGLVTIRFLGACIGCPSSAHTPHQGIERLLKERVPEVTGVKAIEGS